MIQQTYKYDKSRFATYDIETLGLIPMNFLYGIVYYGDRYDLFLDKYKMIDSICNIKNAGKVFFAHNCEYDLSGLCDENLLKYFDDVLYRGSHFIGAKKCVYSNKNSKKYVRFWDSFRILMSGLSKIGKQMKQPKLETPSLLLNPDNLSYTEGKKIFMNEWKNTELKDYYIKYCLLDCIILYNALKEFQNFTWDNFTIPLKPTISSIAFSIWKKNYQDRLWNDCNTQPNMAFKESYYGGRVDLFSWGKTNNIHEYDINSLYPYMGLKDYPHPFKLYKTTDPDTVFNNEGCGYFTIHAPYMDIPILPYRYEGKLLFPYGEFNGWYNYNEVRYAIENGYDCNLHYGYFAHDTIAPLREYYLDMYEFRKKYPRDDFRNTIVKYLLNSLYGRFGLKIENKKYMYDYEYWNDKDELYENWEFTILSPKDGFGYATDRENPYYLSKTTYYAIPSYLTSYARIHLHKYLQKYKDNLLYCDTDSIFLRNVQLDNSDINNEMGNWKYEGCFDSGWFMGLKFYSLLENEAIWYKWNEIDIKIKGLRYPEILNRMDDMPDSKTIISYYKNKESLRHNKIAGTKKITEKHINPYVFDKRIYDSDINYRYDNSKTFPIEILK